MKEPGERSTAPWRNSPTVKAKNDVQRSVSALLDELAPERVLRRGEELVKRPIEQHRTPTGCVLQAADSAISVSWIAAAANDAGLGELHIVVWRGTVARRGATRHQKGASIVAELSLRPVEPPTANCLWRASDGTEYDAASLAAKCLELLEGQIGSAG
jgi:hypothetical protein